MIRFLCIAFLALAVVALVAPDVQAQRYTIEQTLNGGYNAWIKGQTFTPSIGIDPDPGAVTTLNLRTVTFYRSSQGWAGPTSHFYLNIYDGDPVNGSGVFVGSSTNTIDVDQVANMEPMTWEFDFLALDYNHEYWALVSSTNVDGGLDVYCGMRESGGDEYLGGNAIAGTNSDPFGFTIKSNDIAFDIVLRGDAYMVEQTVNSGYNPWIKGQTFTPSIDIDPDPGTVSALDLTAVTFFRSSQGWAGPTSHFYLNIYDGDPVNGSGAIVGSSLNTVDVDPLGNFDPMTWTFDNLTLDYNHEYWALVSSTNTHGGFDVYCGMRESGGDEYTGGTAIAGTSGDPFSYTVKSNDIAFEILLLDSGAKVDVKCNGADAGAVVPSTDNATVTINVYAGDMGGVPVELWVLGMDKTTGGQYTYGYYGIPLWLPGLCNTYFSGGLMDISETVLDQAMPAGQYEVYIAVDLWLNGKINIDFIHTYDMVDFEVVP